MPIELDDGKKKTPGNPNEFDGQTMSSPWFPLKIFKKKHTIDMLLLANCMESLREAWEDDLANIHPEGLCWDAASYGADGCHGYPGDEFTSLQ